MSQSVLATAIRSRRNVSSFSFLLLLSLCMQLTFGNLGWAQTTSGGSSSQEARSDNNKAKKLKKAKDKAKKKCEEECKEKQEEAEKAAKAAEEAAKRDKEKKAAGAVSSGSIGQDQDPPPANPPADPPVAPPPFDLEACIKDCCSEAYQELVTKHSDEKWKFDEDLDSTHEQYHEIIESILDSLIDTLNAEDEDLLESKIIWDIKNELFIAPDGIKPLAYYTPILDGDGNFTGVNNITFYNPQAPPKAGFFMPSRLAGMNYAQPADETLPPQFTTLDFIRLTVYHELANVAFFVAVLKNPQVLQDWMTVWAASLADPTSVPQQQLFDHSVGAFSNAYTHHVGLGFAVARSYYKMGWVFGDAAVWNYIAWFNK